MAETALAPSVRERIRRIAEPWKLAALVGAFLVFYFAPLGDLGAGRLQPAFALLHEYARAHVLTCLVPAFFIAGAIAVYLNKGAVLRYLGPEARRIISYPLASLSGGVLAVCSCTVLPLFAGIFKRGAGLGPAIAFVFTGPAINVTAIFLTASVLGWQFAAFRLGAAMLIAIVAGLVMVALFERGRTDEGEKPWSAGADAEDPGYPGAAVGVFLGAQLFILVVLGIGAIPPIAKLAVVAVGLAAVLWVTFARFRSPDRHAWIDETWTFTKQIMPLLFVGVFLAGMIAAFLPERMVAGTVGGNGLAANAVASVSGALMYFATLTEIPILQSLMRLGMGDGPVMAMLLTGNALSIPNLIVLNRILGPRRTATYLAITVSMSIVAGLLFGSWMA